MAEEKTATSTFDYYKTKIASDKTALERLVEDSERLVGSVTTHIMSAKEFMVRTLRKPPSVAFYDPTTKECTVISSPEMGVSFPMIWVLVNHEKGHHFEYPRTDWRRLLEMGTIKVALEDAGVSNAMPSDFSISRPICMDVLNIIEDALVNYMYMFNENMERDLEYFGWFALMNRSMYESGLLGMDISKSTPLTNTMEFHYRFMTALSWFYLGVDSLAPSGVVKKGMEPFRGLCEMECFKCHKTFATFNFRCPHCLEWNNTLDHTPAIKMITDPRSPIVTPSSNKDVVRQYELLQEYFVWVMKLDWARRQPAGEQDDIFFNKFYRHLASVIARLVKSGCWYGPTDMVDRPKFLRLDTLIVMVGGKKVDIIQGLREATFHGRGIFEFCQTCQMAHSGKYEDFEKSLGGLSVDKVLPTSSDPIYGEFDPAKYKSIDDWDERDIEARTTKKFASLKNDLLREKWDQARFEAEFLKFLSTLTDDEKPRALIIAGGNAPVLAQFGIDWDKFTEKLRGEKVA